MKLNEQEINAKLDLVIDRLLHLDGPANEAELKKEGEKVGYFKRDFGIREWDWPQGVGLYGLLRVMQAENNTKYVEFLKNWYDTNIKAGLPSRNINTTTPLLTLAQLNETLHDKKYEALCLDWADWLMTCLPRTREGGFQHVTSANGDRKGVRASTRSCCISSTSTAPRPDCSTTDGPFRGTTTLAASSGAAETAGSPSASWTTWRCSTTP